MALLLVSPPKEPTISIFVPYCSTQGERWPLSLSIWNTTCCQHRFKKVVSSKMEFKWMQHGGNKSYQHACVLQVRQHHTAQISKPLLPKFTTPHFKNWKLPNIRKVLPVFFTYQQVWGCPTNYEHFKIVCIKLYKTRFHYRTMPKCWNVPNRFFLRTKAQSTTYSKVA